MPYTKERRKVDKTCPGNTKFMKKTGRFVQNATSLPVFLDCMSDFSWEALT
ncbi:hypothetical protein K010075C41_01840 [Sellimonas intestinalis]